METIKGNPIKVKDYFLKNSILVLQLITTRFNIDKQVFNFINRTYVSVVLIHLLLVIYKSYNAKEYLSEII